MQVLRSGRGVFARSAGILYSLCLAYTAYGQTLSMSSPLNNARLNGIATLTATAANLPADASVSFLFNGQPIHNGRDTIEPVKTVPYTVRWDTFAEWDSYGLVTAVATNAAGSIIATSAAVPVQIVNRGVTVTHVAPLGQISGTVNWIVQATGLNTSERSWNCYIDGAPLDIIFNRASQISFPLDSTKLRNGIHELSCSIWYATGGRAQGASTVRVQVNNGVRSLALRPAWSRMFLTPSQTVKLPVSVVNTDGTARPVVAWFSSSNPVVASVDAAGMITAGQSGSAVITMNAEGMTSTASVMVTGSASMPHFSRTGQILPAYVPGSSIFVRSMFRLGPEEVDSTPGLGAAVQKAAVNTLTTGIFYNPADNSVANFTEWQASMNEKLNANKETAARWNTSLLFVGDDIARTREELDYSVNAPDGPAMVRHVMSFARDCRCAVGVDMIDETDNLWGDTPRPTDNRWSPLADDSFVRLMQSINIVTGRPALSWPVSGGASQDAVQNWLNNPAFSDFASIFWANALSYRPAHSNGFSLSQQLADINSVVDPRLAALRPMPALMLTSAVGPFYDKRVSGSQFTPRWDILRQSGDSPEMVAAQILLAVEKGMAGVRAYMFDTSDMKLWRKDAGIGAAELETGTDGVTQGSRRWAAMSAAFNLIRTIEPFVLQPQMHAIDLGPAFYTGAKQGAAGRMFAATNFSAVPETAVIPLATYNAGGKITRYVLTGDRVATASVASPSVDSVVLAPGASVVYTFAR